MAEPAVATNVHQAFDIHGYFSPKRSFDSIVLRNYSPNTCYIVVREVVHSDIFVHAGFLQYEFRTGQTETVDIGQSNNHPFVLWQINSSYSSQSLPPLLSLIPGVAYAGGFCK